MTGTAMDRRSFMGTLAAAAGTSAGGGHAFSFRAVGKRGDCSFCVESLPGLGGAGPFRARMRHPRLRRRGRNPVEHRRRFLPRRARIGNIRRWPAIFPSTAKATSACSASRTATWISRAAIRARSAYKAQAAARKRVVRHVSQSFHRRSQRRQGLQSWHREYARRLSPSECFSR